MARFSFDAQPTAALFDRTGAVFALGDGSVRFESGERADVHDGAILCACVHPSGDGILTGGDDGRVAWVRREDSALLAETGQAWIDALDASAESGLIAFSHGRTLQVRDSGDAGFQRAFVHERTVSDLAFDAKGRRIACSTYGGAAVWFARIAEQKPVMLKWAGSHTAVGFSPDGAFVVTAMQDNQMHGWRLKDQRNLRMGGYPSKIRSFAFLSNGALMATSGANGVVLWPFTGANGPMGREASEIGFEDGIMINLVAAALKSGRVAAGLSDGRVWSADPAAQGLNFVRSDRGAPICALAMSNDGTRLAWGDEGGAAGVDAL